MRRLEVTIYEQFTFCLNTILSDVAAQRLPLRDTIVEHQLALLEELVEDVVQFVNGVRGSSPSSSPTRRPSRRLSSQRECRCCFSKDLPQRIACGSCR